MHRWLVGVATIAVVQVATAGTHRMLSGVVVDELTGEPVAGVNLTSRHGTVATGADGTFTIAVAGDDIELFVTAPGYVMQTIPIGPSDTLRISLVTNTELIEVTGSAPKQPETTIRIDPGVAREATRPRAQSYALTPDDLRVLPGTGNDALRAAQVLPGVARLPYSFGGVVLRGAAPRDSAVYLDGIEVPIAFHFGGVTSFYPSVMLEDLQVTNSGIDAAYGRASGGMISLRSREPRADRWRTGGSIGLLDSSIFAEGPYNGGSVLVGLRRSYFDIVASPFAADSTPMPSYWDAQFRSSFGSATKRGRIAPMLFLALDNMTYTTEGNDMHENETSVSSFFVRVAAPYERRWGETTLRIVPWIGANKLDFGSRVNGVTETFTRPTYPGGVRGEVATPTRWGDIRTGVDVQGGYLTHYQAGLGHKGDILVQMNGETDIDWVDLGLWGESRFDVDRLSIKPGVRLDRYGLNDEGVIDPRLSLGLQLSQNWRLRETLGRYHQPPTPGDVDPNGGNPKLTSSYTDSVSLGIEGSGGDGWSGSLTGYYSRGNDLGVRLDNGSHMDFSRLTGLGPTFSLLLEKQLGLAFYRENLGRARNVGAEILVRRTTPRWMWLVAYTLASAERHDGPGTVGWRPFELDQRHNINVAGSTVLGPWRLGARAHLVTGMPYSPTIGIDGNGDPVLDPYAGRLPTFYQFDVRVDRLWERCWGQIDLYFDIQNITNRRNVEGRATNAFMTGDDDIHGLPIMPFIGVEFIPR